MRSGVINTYFTQSGSDLLCSLKLLRQTAFFTAIDETLNKPLIFLPSLTASSTVESTSKTSLRILEAKVFLSIGVSDGLSGTPYIIKFSFLSHSSFSKEVTVDVITETSEVRDVGGTELLVFLGEQDVYQYLLPIVVAYPVYQ